MEEKRKMSNSNHTRGFLPLGHSRKREAGPRTGSDGFKRPPKLIRPTSNPAPNPTAYPIPAPTPTPTPKFYKPGYKFELKPQPGGDNKVLAGFMATEYFEEGTIVGRKYECDPAQIDAIPVLSYKGKETSGGEKEAIGMSKRYAEVANLMKCDGTHLPGIVNPTQLARWLQM